MRKCMTARTQFIATAVFVVAALAALVTGLTLGLQTPALEDGGSPTLPPELLTTAAAGGDGDVPGETTEEPTGEPWNSSFKTFRHAAVASDTVACSKIGVDIMARLGGSAVDAAIATSVCVGVINAHSAGLGGGNFMTVYASPRGGGPKEAVVFNSREMAPAAATEDMFVNNTEAATKGGLAIGVPGELMGFYRAWARFGRVEWAALFEPSIRLCEGGFTVERSLADAIAVSEPHIRTDESLCEQFVNGDDCSLSPFYREGDTMRCEKLAQTMRRIAGDAFTFYNGSLAQDIAADIAEYNGTITTVDLENYVTSEEEPLSVLLSNGNYTVLAPQPPSSGVVLQFMLKVLDGYMFGADSDASPSNKTLLYHRVTEAMKYAYARRTLLGDKDYVNVTDLVANMTSDDYTSAIRELIDDAQTYNYTHYGAVFDSNSSPVGTAHQSVLAPDGSAVAITATVNLFFGSKVRGNRTGLIFNNEMDDFSTPGMDNSFGVPPSPANFIRPGKRPLSSMAPSIVIDESGEVVLLTGASGGTKITTAVLQLILNSVWLDLRLDEATDTPRFHHQLVPNILEYERFFDEEVKEGLEEKGHDTLFNMGSIAVIQSIDNRCRLCTGDCTGQYCVHAVSDGRKGGVPDGY